jgi:uncharacterized protein involved in exopolysaccharide biosynthesis
MDNHATFSSLATLRNICADIERQMTDKHRKMTELKNDFLSLQRQLKDIKSVIESLEKDNSLLQ